MSKQNVAKRGNSCIEKKLVSENPKEKLERWGRSIKYIYQRARYGYCDSDVWSIDYWFLSIIPGMLEQLKEETNGYPSFTDNPSHAVYGTGRPEDIDDEDMGKWQSILKDMIFLFNEANEESCTRKNKYEQQYLEAYKEYEEKYGRHGEKLKTQEEKEREQREGVIISHMMWNLPEYKEISDLYSEEERTISKYRDECKNKGLQLFSKWFWDLWD